MINTIVLNKNTVELKRKATSRIYVFDASGSMYGSIPAMKKHLKEKLLNSVPEGDDISIIYFSGRGEFGVLVESVNISAVKDLKTVYSKIDKLQTIGLTGFVEPLREVGELIKRLPKDNLKELFFLTDGYDNQWSEREVLVECEKLTNSVDNSYIVEYGWYCNTALLKKMTEKLNAIHLFSEDFADYEELSEKVISEGVVKKVNIKITEKTINDIAFYVYNDKISIVNVNENNEISIPEDLKEFSYLSADSLKDNLSGSKEDYLALYAYASRKDSKTVYEILAKLGDVKLIKQYVNTFGKQDVIKFLNNVELAIKDESQRMVEGCDRSVVPSEDAYNVVEMIQDLMTKGNLLYTDHEAFQYKKIGRAKVAVSVEERLQKAKEALSKSTEVEDLKEQAEKMVNLLNSEDLKFQAKDSGKGIEISNLTWNENRPNLSVLIRKEGFIDLPKNKFNLSKMDTFIFRNFTIIKDGILNLNRLPVSLVKETFDTLQKNGLLKNEVYEDGKIYILEFNELPIINRKMVKSVSAKELFTQQLNIETIKARNKVFKDYLKQLEPKTSVNWKNDFGEEAVAWLAEMGLTEYNGFAPKVKSAESTDFYIGKSLELKVKGLSSLPKVSDVEKALKEGKKLGLKDLAMAQAIEEYTKFISTLSDKSEDEIKVAKIEFLKSKLEELKKLDKELTLSMSQIKFAIIIGQTWFKEFDSEENSTLDLDYLGTKATITAELKDIEVKI
jgi:hypothetical protein